MNKLGKKPEDLEGPLSLLSSICTSRGGKVEGYQEVVRGKEGEGLKGMTGLVCQKRKGHHEVKGTVV